MAAAGKGWALVTGAGRGIGRAIAVALSKQGYPVAIVARSAPQLEETGGLCKAAGAPEILSLAMDLGQPAQADSLVEQLLKTRPIDVLVNNAGIGVSGNADEGDPDEWEKMMNVRTSRANSGPNRPQINVNAPMRLVRRISPGMIERETGTIINMGSIAAIEAMQSSGAYAASKHAIRGWSLSTYQRLRKYGIKTVLINPAFVNTDMVSKAKDMGAMPERMLSVEDVTAAAMFALVTSPACCPEEITLRLTKPAFG